jgi:hypothetical protein
MHHPVRAVFTFFGAASAGFLIWLSTQFGAGLGAYWAKIGLLAAAGLVLSLSQLLGGWTKWWWPRFSPLVLLIGFVPALIVAGWVILAGQPDPNWFQRHVTSWSGDLHVARLVRHLRESYLDVLAAGLGLLFGFSFDTTGPRVVRQSADVHPAAGAAPVVTPPEPATAAPPEETAVTRVEPWPQPPPEETAETRVTPSGESTPPG